MDMYDVKPRGKTICALCCSSFMACKLTDVKEINKCCTHKKLLDRYGDKTVGELTQQHAMERSRI